MVARPLCIVLHFNLSLQLATLASSRDLAFRSVTTMCTPREDCCWPLLGTAVPYWNPTAGRKYEAPVVIVSLDEVKRKRREFSPSGQSSLHLACQRNSPLASVRVLVKACPRLLSQVDNEGNTPIMLGMLDNAVPVPLVSRFSWS